MRQEKYKAMFCPFKHDSLSRTFFVPLVTILVPFLLMFPPRQEQQQEQKQKQSFF